MSRLLDDPQQSSVHTLVRWTGGAERTTIDSANEPFVWSRRPDGRGPDH